MLRGKVEQNKNEKLNAAGIYQMRNGYLDQASHAKKVTQQYAVATCSCSAQLTAWLEKENTECREDLVPSVVV